MSHPVSSLLCSCYYCSGSKTRFFSIIMSQTSAHNPGVHPFCLVLSMDGYRSSILLSDKYKCGPSTEWIWIYNLSMLHFSSYPLPTLSYYKLLTFIIAFRILCRPDEFTMPEMCTQCSKYRADFRCTLFFRPMTTDIMGLNRCLATTFQRASPPTPSTWAPHLHCPNEKLPLYIK